MGDVLVHEGPEPLDGIEMGARGRQSDQMNETVFARQERSDIGAFVVWGIVPNDVNDPFIRVSRLDFGQQLRSAEPIDGGWFNEGRVEGFQVQSTVNVRAPAPGCCLDGGVCPFAGPAIAGFTLIFWMNGIREVDDFVGRQIIQQVFIKCDECGLLFNISHTG